MTHTFVRILVGSDIPHRAQDLSEPPSKLYVVGELPRGPSVAVVGTRHPTPEAIEFTEELVAGLAASGCSIWSGGAEGIDCAAHRAALRVKAKTVVVAPAGWLRPYPEKHQELYQTIIENGGTYLSVVPPNRAAQQHLFFARNALLVALTHGVVVVQAGFRSGARNAAKTARHLGRPLFVVPSCPWVHQGLGCNLELALGARPVGSAKDVIKQLSASGLFGAVTTVDEVAGVERLKDLGSPIPAQAASNARSKTGASVALDEELEQLLEQVRQGARNVDELCQRTGWPAAVVQSDVLRLTLQGEIRVGRSGVIEIVSQ